MKASSARTFDVDAIDDVIHSRLRLGIMAYLAKAEAADFSELKTALKATQGNLSIQLRKLEDAGYLTIDKSFVDRKPLTRAQLTRAGRKAFLAYLDAMAKLIDDSRRARCGRLPAVQGEARPEDVDGSDQARHVDEEKLAAHFRELLVDRQRLAGGMCIEAAADRRAAAGQRGPSRWRQRPFLFRSAAWHSQRGQAARRDDQSPGPYGDRGPGAAAHHHDRQDQG